MIRKRLVSLFLAVVMLCSLSMTAFAASDEDVAMSAEQGIIASETFEIPVSLSLDELDEMKSELEECGKNAESHILFKEIELLQQLM